MKSVFWAAALMASVCANAANAGPREDVLTCVGSMNTDADWAICRNLMFKPCATDEVGSETHIACLSEEKNAWLSEIETRRVTLSEQLTSDSLGAVTDLYGQWIAYVGQKCPSVALKNAATSKEAAQLGCEISESVGMAAEFESCLNGTSTAPYCIIEE